LLVTTALKSTNWLKRASPKLVTGNEAGDTRGLKMGSSENRQIVLASRPTALPDATHLQLRRTVIPEPGPGQIQVKHLYIALSPSARLRMSGDSDYGKGMVLGEVVAGQTVGVVSQSRNSEFREGEHVVTNGGWQEYSIGSGRNATRLDPTKLSPQDALGLLGTSGLTAYVGLLKFGSLREGETLLVSAASGSVGSVAGQIGKIIGCRVVGITGGVEKCRYLTQELGFDAAVDHRSPNFGSELGIACSKGVDAYFENVGGAVLGAAWPLMADFGRVILCGMISQYNDAQNALGPSWFPILARRLTVRGFLLRDHFDQTDAFRNAAMDWIANGKLRMRYDVTDGIDQAPSAFVRMLEGANFGKSIVKVADA
jgi:NADPH-dependent curcumin reductase